MRPGLGAIISEIRDLAKAFPRELIEQLAMAVEQMDRDYWTYAKTKIVNSFPQAALQPRVSRLFEVWETRAPEIAPQSVSLALFTAAQVEDAQRQRQEIELVWTGPDSHVIPLRRTDQALLQLIQESKSTLTIVSFAVYKVAAIAEALVAAARRGVQVNLCLETADASEGKVAYDTIKAIGAEVAHHAAFYIWPLDQRPLSPAGKHGALHAKVAIADGEAMLLSSANLTDYALTLNMELGLLIHGGDLPGQVEQHFRRLMESGVLKKE